MCRLIRMYWPTIELPRATPIQSDYELLVQRLLGTVQPVQPRLQERSSITDMEVLLQSLPPGCIGGGRDSVPTG